MFIKEENENRGTDNFSVKIRKNENVENLIKRFVKKTKKERIIEEVLNRKYYKKPTTKRREDLSKRKATLEKLKAKEKLELQLND